MSKLKLNIQYFGSTNKTTHYNLSQYVASDKPTYLVDYNADMLAIDTAIYNAMSKATVNESNIGTMTDLTTESKSSLVGAINEVDSHADTNASNISQNTIDIASNTGAIGNLINLETTAKNNLVGAINELKGVNDTQNTEIGNLTNLKTIEKTNLVGAINELDDKFGNVLWTNQNPDSNFEAQTITLSSSEYDVLEVFFNTSGGNVSSARILKGTNTFLSGDAFANNSIYHRFREMTRVDDTHYSFGDGKQQATYDTTVGTLNSIMKPLYIIGYKFEF